MKFNQKTLGSKTENLAEGKAYKQVPKIEFVSLLLTSFVEDQFYRNKSQSLNKLTELMNSISDKKFLAKASVFARNEFGMRSITHATAGELANSVKGEAWLKNYFNKVVYRADDITEILAYYLAKFGKPVPNSMKKGLGTAFNKFDAYQLAKYRREGAKVSLVDAVNLLHPKPSDKNADAMKQLIEGKLKSTDTWESKLTQAGQKAETEEQKAELKADAWKSLIKERKIGYFALLRNLRNISEQAPNLVSDACELLTDEKLIKNSLVLPFRFQTAMKEVGNRDMKRALNKALDISCTNVPKFEGKTLVAIDTSGSMDGRPSEIATLFGAILAKSNDSDVLSFDTKATWEKYNPDDSVMTIAGSFSFRGGGTSFPLIFDHAKEKYDRIIILSDMQSWSGGWGGNPQPNYESYKKRTGADPFIYSFDLEGYGTTEFITHKNLQIAGFSEKIFDVMKIMEQDRNALVKRIEEVKI